MKRELSKKRKGFTLIELVIVIVIIGVLAGIASLNYSNVTQSSKDGVAKANLRAIKSAVILYQAKTGGGIPQNLDAVKSFLEEDAYSKPVGYTYTLTRQVTTKPYTVTLFVIGGGLTGTNADTAVLGENKYVIQIE